VNCEDAGRRLGCGRSLVAWGARRLRQRRTIVGGHDEAERSERGGGGRGEPKGRANPFRVTISERCLCLSRAGYWE
jgi:hypothetical protein